MSLLLDALDRARQENEDAGKPASATSPLTLADQPPGRPEPTSAAASASAATPKSTVTPPPPAAPRPSSASASVSPQVARDILNASAPATPTRKPMTIALLIGAGIVILGMGSFLLGLWDDQLSPPQPPVPKQAALMKANQASQPARPAAPPAAPPAPQMAAAPGDMKPAATPVPPVTPAGNAMDAPVSAAEKSAKTSAAMPMPAERKPVQPSAGKPVFIAKPGSAHALDSAYAALNEGRLDDAAAGYRQALKQNPAERDALLGLAYIAHRQGRTEEARQLYQQVLRQDPAQPTAAAGLLALQTNDDNPTRTTLDQAQEMAERQPDSAAAFAALGSSLVREGRLADAQQAFFRAFSLEPENCFHAYNLAVALDRLHKHDLALGYYERALALADQAPAALRGSFPRENAQFRRDQLRHRSREERVTLP